jgi:hypothetical protein
MFSRVLLLGQSYQLMQNPDMVCKVLAETDVTSAPRRFFTDNRRVTWLITSNIENRLAVLTRSFLVHQAALHHEAYFFEHGDVLRWVSWDGDYVGQVAGLELADLSLPAEQFGSVQ